MTTTDEQHVTEMQALGYILLRTMRRSWPSPWCAEWVRPQPTDTTAAGTPPD